MTRNVGEIHAPHFLANNFCYYYLRVTYRYRKAIHACHYLIIYYYYFKSKCKCRNAIHARNSTRIPSMRCILQVAHSRLHQSVLSNQCSHNLLWVGVCRGPNIPRVCSVVVVVPSRMLVSRAYVVVSFCKSARRLRIRSGILTLCFSEYIRVTGTLCFLGACGWAE